MAENPHTTNPPEPTLVQRITAKLADQVDRMSRCSGWTDDQVAAAVAEVENLHGCLWQASATNIADVVLKLGAAIDHLLDATDSGDVQGQEALILLVSAFRDLTRRELAALWLTLEGPANG